jgi:hypothetical protein
MNSPISQPAPDRLRGSADAGRETAWNAAGHILIHGRSQSGGYVASVDWTACAKSVGRRRAEGHREIATEAEAVALM